MEGRFPRSLLYVLADCKDPAREAELDDWRRNTRLPDVLASGLFHRPVRFVSVAAPQDRDAHCLVTWESDGDAPRELLRKLTELDRDWIHSSLGPSSVRMLRSIDGGFWSRSYRRKVNGIMVVSSNCSDPAREEEFNDWYSNIHLPDVLSTGGFHTAYRYEDVSPVESIGKYWAIYETDVDPVEAARTLDARRDWFVANNRRTDTTRPVRRSLYRRV